MHFGVFQEYTTLNLANSTSLIPRELGGGQNITDNTYLIHNSWCEDVFHARTYDPKDQSQSQRKFADHSIKAAHFQRWKYRDAVLNV